MFVCLFVCVFFFFFFSFLASCAAMATLRSLRGSFVVFGLLCCLGNLVLVFYIFCVWVVCPELTSGSFLGGKLFNLFFG